jgi:Fe-S oxidoreductase
VIVGLIVLVSALIVLRKLAHKLTNRWLAAASIRYSQPGRAAWVRAFGRRLQPKEATGNCSDGCSTCGACGPKPPAGARTEPMPLEFRSRQ